MNLWCAEYGHELWWKRFYGYANRCKEPTKFANQSPHATSKDDVWLNDYGLDGAHKRHGIVWLNANLSGKDALYGIRMFDHFTPADRKSENHIIKLIFPNLANPNWRIIVSSVGGRQHKPNMTNRQVPHCYEGSLCV